MKKTILLIEDDEYYSSITCNSLQKEGFKVICSYDGKKAIEIFKNNKIDLILLDIILEPIDGLKVLNEIRNNSNIPVIMLTSLNNNKLQEKCLALGINDYIVKPCCEKLLIMKIESVLNEQSRLSNISSGLWTYRKLEVNFSKKIVIIEGESVSLGKKRLDILEFFVNNKGHILSRDQIINVVWGSYCEINYRTVDAHISKLRTTLNLDCLETISGYGYILNC